MAELDSYVADADAIENGFEIVVVAVVVGNDGAEDHPMHCGEKKKKTTDTDAEADVQMDDVQMRVRHSMLDGCVDRSQPIRSHRKDDLTVSEDVVESAELDDARVAGTFLRRKLTRAMLNDSKVV